MSDLDPTTFANRYLADLKAVIDGIPVADLARAMDALARAHVDGRRVFLAGNGGSSATATHMGNDLAWGMTQIGAPPIRAISLCDNLALTTAVANDIGYEHIFSVPLKAWANPGDLLLVITGSGNSPNILHVLGTAREMGLETIGFLGRGGGKAAAMVDIPVIVPSDGYGPIEDVHMIFDHLVISWFRARAAKA